MGVAVVDEEVVDGAGVELTLALGSLRIEVHILEIIQLVVLQLGALYEEGLEELFVEAGEDGEVGRVRLLLEEGEDVCEFLFYFFLFALLFEVFQLLLLLLGKDACFGV